MTTIRKINVSEIEGRSPFDNNIDDNAVMPSGTVVVYEGNNPGEYVLRVHNGTTDGGVPLVTVNQLISDLGNNTLSIFNSGDAVFSGDIPGGVNRGLVWDYGANIGGGVNSEVRQDGDGLTVRAWTEGGSEPFSAPVRIVTNQDADQKTWIFDGDGGLSLPRGGIIAETVITDNPTIMIRPAEAEVESQALYIKGGALGYINSQNGIDIQTEFNQYAIGDTASFNVWAPNNANTTMFWWLDGADQVTPASGTVLIQEFGGSDASIDVEVLSTAPFRIYVGPTDNDTSTAGVSVSVNGDAGVADHHLHLTTGDLTETSIILGTDDHNVRTTVNGGVEITTPNITNNVWLFGNNGDLELPANGGIVFDRANTTIRVGMGFHISSGEGVSIEAIDETDPDNLVYKNWYFSPDGSITFPDYTVQTTAYPGVSVPTSSLGATGDQAGQIALDTSYIYYCTQNYGGTTYTVVQYLIPEGVTADGLNSGYLVVNTYQLPQVGWKVYYNGQESTITQVNTVGTPGYYVVFTDSAIIIPAEATFAWGPTSTTNIWKRVAWSNDTW